MKKTMIIAHRGASSLAKENTIESFKKAIEIFGRWPPFHKYLGTTYYLLHQYPKASEEFQTTIMLIGRDAPEAAEMEEYLKKIKDMQQTQ